MVTRAKTVAGEDLERAMRACFEVERRMKSGGGDPPALLTALVAELGRA
jgi:DNA polymerase III delta subunit